MRTCFRVLDGGSRIWNSVSCAPGNIWRVRDSKCHSISRASVLYWATNEAGTRHLADQLSAHRRRGDCLCLLGEVGSGKSAFSRAYIQSAEGDDGLPVPSPTYLLQNTYELEDGLDVHHFDLYRLRGQEDLSRLDIHKCIASGVSLIEWAQRLEDAAPADRLDIHFKVLNDDWRQAAKSSGMIPEQIPAPDPEEGEYNDKRWREILLQPYGAHWEEVVSQLNHANQAVADGLHQMSKEAVTNLRMQFAQK